MQNLVRKTIPAFVLLLVVGCVTDEFVVFKDHLVSKEAAERYHGVYGVERWPGTMRPDTVRVFQTDEELRFAYTLPDQVVDLRFVLSKIPNSKKNLHLLSIPAQEDTNHANMFFVGKAEKERTYIWAVFAKLPVASEHLSFQDGKAKADDVKEFLAQHADAFVKANEPQVMLKNPHD